MKVFVCVFVIYIILALVSLSSAAEVTCKPDPGTYLLPGQCSDACNSTIGGVGRTFITMSVGGRMNLQYIYITRHYPNGSTWSFPYTFPMDASFRERVVGIDVCLANESPGPVEMDFDVQVDYYGPLELGFLGTYAVVHGILGFVAVIVFILLIGYAKKQPLKSRGGLPFVHLSFFCIKIGLVQVFNWLTVQSTSEQFLICFLLFLFLM
jgi:hypothetical protein